MRMIYFIVFWAILGKKGALGDLHAPISRPAPAAAVTTTGASSYPARVQPIGFSVYQSPPVDDPSDDAFSRQTIAIGRSAQQRLMRSRVLVVYNDDDYDDIDRSTDNGSSRGSSGDVAIAGLRPSYGGSSLDEFNRRYGLLDEVVRNLALSGVKRISLVKARSSSNSSSSGAPTAQTVEKLRSYGMSCTIDASEDVSRLDASSVSAVVGVNLRVHDALGLNDLCRGGGKAAVKFVYARTLGGLGGVFCDFGNHEFVPKSPVVSANEEVVIDSLVSLEGNASRIDNNNGGAPTMQLTCAGSESFRAFHIRGLADLKVRGSKAPVVMRCEVVKVINAKTVTVRFADGEVDPAAVLAAFNKSGATLSKVDTPEYVVHRSLRDCLNASLSPRIVPTNDLGPAEQTATLSACQVSALLSLDESEVIRNRDTFSRLVTKRAARWLQSNRRSKTASSTQSKGGLLSRVFRWLQSLILPNKEARMARDMESHARRLYDSTCASSSTSPTINSAIGGIAAQEVVKACTGTNKPMSQFYTLESDIRPLSRRNDSSRVLVVGAGAVGCEVLKNLLYAGVASSPCEQSTIGDTNGKTPSDPCIHIVDMDSIEKSNLNRQFLFRPEDIGRPKARVAAESLQRIAHAHNCSINVKSHVDKLGGDRVGDSSFFDDLFWEKGVDVVVSAVDNLDARLYLDSVCVKHRLPLVDVGTMGALGSVQVVVPGLTESYADSADEETELIPTCTIKSFPYKAEHCITWAKDAFDKFFNEDVNFLSELMSKARSQLRVSETSDYRENDSRFAASVGGVLEGRADFELLQLKHWLECISTNSNSNNGDSISNDRGSSRSSDYVEWALKLFFELFDRDVRALVDLHPAGSLDDDGASPFWSGSRARVPVPEEWPEFVNGYKLSVLREFVLWAAVLKARVHGVALDAAQASDALDALEMGGGVEILRSRVMDPENTRERLISDIAELMRRIPIGRVNLVQAQTFDKDDLSLGHVAFVTAAATIRSHVYGIVAPAAATAEHAVLGDGIGEPSSLNNESPSPSRPVDASTGSALDPLFVRAIAGRIVPAILTTTAVAAGIATEEVIKVLDSPYVKNRRNDACKIAPLTISPRKGLLFSRWLHRNRPTGPPIDRAARFLIDKVRPEPIISDKLADTMRSQFRNAYINLASGSLGFSSPAPPAEEGGEEEEDGAAFTKWDFVKVPFSAHDGSVDDLLRFLEEAFPSCGGDVASIVLLEEGVPIYSRDASSIRRRHHIAKPESLLRRVLLAPFRLLQRGAGGLRLKSYRADARPSETMSIAQVISQRLAQAGIGTPDSSDDATGAPLRPLDGSPPLFRDLLLVPSSHRRGGSDGEDDSEGAGGLPKLRLYYR